MGNRKRGRGNGKGTMKKERGKGDKKILVNKDIRIKNGGKEYLGGRETKSGRH